MIPANYSTISFPSLGIEVNPGRALALGPLTIHYYGLIIAIGLMLAVVYACRRCSQFGIKQDDLLDGVLWVTPFAILCARAYYCIFSWADYAENPISVLYIWNGGLAIYGGVLGAVAGIFAVLIDLRLPQVLEGVVSSMAGVATPMALLTLGAFFDFQSIANRKKDIAICVIGRLAVVPAIGLTVGILLGFRAIELVTLIAIFASPSAVSSFPMAQQMDSDAELAGDAVVFSSMFSCFTMFLWIFAAKSLGLF